MSCPFLSTHKDSNTHKKTAHTQNLGTTKIYTRLYKLLMNIDKLASIYLGDIPCGYSIYYLGEYTPLFKMFIKKHYLQQLLKEL